MPSKSRRTPGQRRKRRGKKGNDDDHYEDDEDEDSYSALSKMWKNGLQKPLVGSFEDRARCENYFTVVRLSVPRAFVASVSIMRIYRPNTRWPRTLRRGGCAICAKSSGAEPFKEHVPPRKRSFSGEKCLYVRDCCISTCHTY